LLDDIIKSQNATDPGPLSAISTINGQDVTKFLTEFAALNSVGTIESHADWNQLMDSPAQVIQGLATIFAGGATFYPGDSITFVLENGTQIGPEPWLAVYNSPGDTGPLETGGDFYNFFVLGYYPASYNPFGDDGNDGAAATSAAASSAAASSTANPAAASATDSASPTSVADPSPSSWDNPAYPLVPNIYQADLGTYGGGFVSGYFLEDESLAVLSIPSFDEYGLAINTFSQTVTNFLNASVTAGLKKVVIDLQQNSGGQPLLAIDTFKQFFPTIDPYGGSRMRAHASANVMGETVTNWWLQNLTDEYQDYYNLAANEWMIADRLDDAGQNFSSWQEFYGPNLYNSDNFTNVVSHSKLEYKNY